MFTADPNIPLLAQPGSVATLTVPLPLNPPPSAEVMIFTGSTGTDLKIDLPAGSWYVLAYYDDPADGGLGWHKSSSYPQNGPGFLTFANLPFGTNNEIPVMISTMDATLPVELSIFNATLTAQNFVKLSWVSESETSMLGYRVYRSENADQATATMITPVMVEATNTSTTAMYSIEDREVYAGNTYYYWLEAVEFGTSQFFGPQSVVVLNNETPELPVQSALKNAYPNPFKANTTIEVAIKSGEAGNVNIYNIAGQLVKTYSVNEGTHNINWNGRDSKGNICGSGVYYFQLSTLSFNQTRKMVIVK